MKRNWFVISLVLVLGLLVAACGGGGSKAPVDMESEETSAFDIERPKDWTTNSMDLFGVTILIASSADIAAETVFESGDFTDSFQDAPGVIIMTVPQEMAEEGGDFGFSAEEIKNIPTEEEDVEIVRQGDVTIDGVKGYELGGIFDFEIAGILDIHEDFFRLYFVSSDLVDRVVSAYEETHNQATLDRARIDLYWRAFLIYLMMENVGEGNLDLFQLYKRLLIESEALKRPAEYSMLARDC